MGSFMAKQCPYPAAVCNARSLISNCTVHYLDPKTLQLSRGAMSAYPFDFTVPRPSCSKPTKSAHEMGRKRVLILGAAGEWRQQEGTPPAPWPSPTTPGCPCHRCLPWTVACNHLNASNGAWGACARRPRLPQLQRVLPAGRAAARGGGVHSRADPQHRQPALPEGTVWSVLPLPLPPWLSAPSCQPPQAGRQLARGPGTTPTPTPHQGPV